MKLIYMEPVLEEIEKQQEYSEQAEDFDCAEAVMSAKWAVINAKEVEAIPVEWIQAQVDNEKRAPLFRRYADALLTIWQKEQEGERWMT